MAFEERVGFRFSDGDCLSFISLDTPLYQKQVDMLAEEFNDILGEGNEFEQLVWNTMCEAIDHDGYGSFRFTWNHALMDFLTDDQLEEVQECVNTAFGNTVFFENWATMNGCQEDFSNFEDEYSVESYINAISELGYKIDWDYEKDIVPKKFHKNLDHLRTLQTLKHNEEETA